MARALRRTELRPRLEAMSCDVGWTGYRIKRLLGAFCLEHARVTRQQRALAHAQTLRVGERLVGEC